MVSRIIKFREIRPGLVPTATTSGPKREGNASVKQMESPKLQTLLEDRFKLMLRRETRQLPVYELTVVKGGVKLQRSKEGGCTPYSVDSPPPRTPASGEPRPTFWGFPRFGVDGLNRTLEGAGVSIAELATSLSRSELSVRQPCWTKLPTVSQATGDLERFASAWMNSVMVSLMAR
jgi:uncharacterized protein (TIGR03435 family)